MQSQPSTTTQINKTELPAWVDAAAQRNLAEADRIAGKTPSFYQGDRVADNSANIAKVSSIWEKLSGPASSTEMQQWMNPYIDNVETKALEALDRNRTLSLNANSDAASKASAFGGSRHGIIDAVTNSESAREAGTLSAGLRADAFGQATSDRMSSLTGAAGGLLQTGMLDQANRQALIDSDIAKFNEPRDREIEDLNLKMSALGMTPYGQNSTQTTTAQKGSSGMDFGSLGLGVLSLLFGLSDDDSKEDKQKVGETDSGLGIWAFRYKGDPKDYPKSIGLMASEVEKKHPEFVETLGSGTRVVNYAGLESKGLLAGALANG